MAIRIEVLAEIDQRQVQRETDRMVRTLEDGGQRASKNFGQSLLTGISDVAPKVERSLNTVKTATNNLEKAESALTVAMNAHGLAVNRATVAQMAYDRVKQDSNATDEQRLRVMAAYQSAINAEISTQKALENASVKRVTFFKEESRARQAAIREIKTYESSIGDAIKNRQRDMDSLLQANSLAGRAAESLGKITNALIPGSGIGAVALPLVDALIQLVPVAASASQALLVLPAAAGAAAVGFGTLQLATQGFGDAISNIRDPEKFAESLKLLSPNAQQAALSIKNLLPQIDALTRSSQEAFFNAGGDMLDRLSGQYLPEIERTTTGIAQSFNTMFSSISEELMRPETSQNINTFLDNTKAAFDELAPAAAPFISGLSTLMSVGSTQLPGMTDGLTQMANKFNDFMTDKAATGELQQWMENGLNTLGQLSDVAGNFVDDFMGLAPLGEDILPNIVGALNQTAQTLPEIIELASDGSRIFQDWEDALAAIDPIVTGLDFGFQTLNKTIGGTSVSIGDLIDPLSQVMTLTRSIFDQNYRNKLLGDNGTDQLSKAADAAALSKLNEIRASNGQEPLTKLPDSLRGPNRPNNVDPITGAPRPLPAGAQSTGLGSFMSYQAPGGGWNTPDYVAPSKGAGGSGSTKAQRDAIAAGLDPSLYAIGPGDSAGAYPGDYQAGIIDSQHTVEDKRHKLEEARKDVLVLERDNTATAEEISDAKWKEQDAQWAYQKSQRDLIDAQRGTARDLKNGMDQLGAALDPDLGLSKGLAGLAENLVKFIGNIIAAPELAKLQGQVNADPTKGGFGLFGIHGAQNMAAGNSPLLGVPGGYGGTPGYGGAPGYGGNGAYPGDAALLANVPAGKYSQAGNRDLLAGLSDCSSSIGDLVSLLDTGSTAGPNLTTGNAAEWLTSRGFVQGTGGPGDFRVGYNAGHMQATLPGGTPFNYGSDAAAANRGIGGTGAADSSLSQHYYRPAGAGPVGLTNGGPTSPPIYPTTTTPPAPPYGTPAPPRGAPTQGKLPDSYWTQNLPGKTYTQADLNSAVRSLKDPNANTVDSYKRFVAAGGSHADAVRAAADQIGFDPTTGKITNPLSPDVVLGPGLGMGGGGPGIPNGPMFIPQNPPPGADGIRIGGSGTAHRDTSDESEFYRMWGHLPQGRPLNTGNAGAGLPPIQGTGPGLPPILGNGFGGPGTPNPSFDPGIAPIGAPGGQGNDQVGPFPTPPSLTPTPYAPGQSGVGGPTRIGGLGESSHPGSGGGGFGIAPGGSLDTAIGIGAGALDMIAPGAGQAASTGIKLIGRAVEYGGQLAGIATQGVMDTVLPTGGSALAQNSWFTRILGGLAGAKPAIPNTAGGPQGQQGGAQPPLTPEQTLALPTTGGPGTPGPGNNITINTNQEPEGERLARTVSYHNETSHAAPGRR